MCPVDGTQAHGARFARGVDNATREVERVQLLASPANGVHFRMSRGVEIDGDTITAAGNDFSVLDDDSAEGTAATQHTLAGQPDGLTHKSAVLFCDGYSFHNFFIK